MPGDLAIIPARGGSKRIPRKNLAELAGTPLIGHAIAIARRAGLFEAVIVSTEDGEIGRTAEAHGAEFWQRPATLADDHTHVDAVCAQVVEAAAAAGRLGEAFCCIYPTAAFITPTDLQGARQRFRAKPQPDVVMGVSSYPIHPYKALRQHDGFLQPEFPEKNRMRTQDMPRFVASNGTLYWALSPAFRAQPTFYPERLAGYELPAERAVDIDTPDDLVWAQKLMAMRDS